MPTFLTGRSLSTAIRSITSGSHADLAVAFWGGDACDLLKISSKNEGVRIACDAFRGGCNPKAIKALIQANVQIVDLPKLHAKVYIGNSKMVVCSANASANGLGEEDNEVDLALDAGILTNDIDQISEAKVWFEKIFKNGNPITIKDLPIIRRAWKENRQSRPSIAGKSFLEMLCDVPEFFADRKLKVAIYTDKEPPKKIVKAYKASPFWDGRELEKSRDYPFYFDVSEDWGAEEGDSILDIGIYKGEFHCEGVWKVFSAISNGEILPATHVTRPLNLKILQGDRSAIAASAKILVENGTFDIDGPLIDVFTFAKAVSELTRHPSA